MSGADRIAVEDRLAIIDLLSGYALYLDQGDMERWLGVFLPDSVMEVPGMEPIRGHRSLMDMARSAPKGTHLVAPPVIRPGDGPDSARSEQSFMFRSDSDGGMLSGWYCDTLVRREGRWYLAARSVQYGRRSRRRIVQSE